MAALATVTVNVADAPAVKAALAALEAEIVRLRAEVAELTRDRDDWEDQYERLLTDCGGTWPG